MFKNPFIKKVRKQIIGINTKVPLLSGRHVKYTNLDNAASTPAFKRVHYKVKDFLKWYSNVHRGSGFKSQLSTDIYEQVHDLIAEFVGADPEKNTVILVKNTTEAINKLAANMNLSKKDIVITTLMEHHSNMLPWRKHAKVIYTGLKENGKLDLADLEEKLATHQSQVKLVAVCGASNVTGHINPIHKIARLAHKYDSQIMVDAAQLAPHRPIDIKDNQDPEHIDYLSFSAHKMYAPFGSGVLIGPKKEFNDQVPDYRGGGTIKVVTLDDVVWADLPDKEEAGTPDITGAVALGTSIKTIEELGWEKLIKQEEKLREYTLEKLQELEGIKLYGTMQKNIPTKQVAVIPFNLESISHSLAAAILAHEGGIGVRSGCFCAHPYIYHLLNLTTEEVNQFKQKINQGKQVQKPGLVRLSYGCYNTIREVDRLIDILKYIINQKQSGKDLTANYEFNSTTNEYQPKKDYNYQKYFKL